MLEQEQSDRSLDADLCVQKSSGQFVLDFLMRPGGKVGLGDAARVDKSNKVEAAGYVRSAMGKARSLSLRLV